MPITLLLFALAQGGAVTPLFEVHGSFSGDYFGHSMAALPDMNGDGHWDLLVGASGHDRGSLHGVGKVQLLSGADQTVLLEIEGGVDGGRFGTSATGLGDIDGDGITDFAVGATGVGLGGGTFGVGAVYVHSGAHGNLLRTHFGSQTNDWFGETLASLRDLDGDGVRELMVGAPGADLGSNTNAGRVFVYSGATGTLLRQILPANGVEGFGHSLANAGDVDADGLEDCIIGAPDWTGVQPYLWGSAAVHSGRDGSLIHRIDSEPLFRRVGSSVAGIGDVDGDGNDDLLVGAEFSYAGGVLETGEARVYSGATGEILYRRWSSGDDDRFGQTAAGVGDQNRDGVPDFIVGAPWADPEGTIGAGSAFLYSGLTGDLLQRFDGAGVGDQLGGTNAAAGDFNGNGVIDLALGSFRADVGGGYDLGSVIAHEIDPFLFPSATTFDVSAGGSIDFEIDFPTSEAGAHFTLLASHSHEGQFTFRNLTIPLAYDSFTQIMAGGGYPIFHHNQGILDANGDAQSWLHIPAGGVATYAGLTMRFAVVSLDLQGLSPRMTSNAVAIRLVP